MAGELQKEVFVVVKVHPLLTKKYPYDNSSMTTDQLLPVTDLLITDYSSIIFEYSIYRRPMLFYAPDMEEYGVAQQTVWQVRTGTCLQQTVWQVRTGTCLQKAAGRYREKRVQRLCRRFMRSICLAVTARQRSG